MDRGSVYGWIIAGLLLVLLLTIGCVEQEELNEGPMGLKRAKRSRATA